MLAFPLGEGTMKRIWTLALLPAFALSMSACSVTKTEEGEAPDVEVEPGKLPEYDVDPAKVEIKTDTKKVIVPDVDVKMPKKDTIKR
jgi:hypothetical protein